MEADPFFHRIGSSWEWPRGIAVRARFNPTLDFTTQVELNGRLAPPPAKFHPWAGARIRAGVLDTPSGAVFDGGASTAIDLSFFRLQAGFDYAPQTTQFAAGFLVYPGSWSFGFLGACWFEAGRPQFRPSAAIGWNSARRFRAQVRLAWADGQLRFTTTAGLSFKRFLCSMAWQPDRRAFSVGFAVDLATLRLGWQTEFHPALGETQEGFLAFVPGGVP